MISGLYQRVIDKGKLVKLGAQTCENNCICIFIGD